MEQVSSNPEVQASFEMFEKGYDAGVQEERERIIAYLIEMDVLREAMFYPGYVAFNTAGTQAMDLPESLGGK